MKILKNKKVYVAGHRGLVGSAIIRYLTNLKYEVKILTETKKKLDLTNQNLTYQWIKKNKPDYVIIAAGKVGGIYANNNYPYDFISINSQIANNLIISSFENKIQNLVYLGSSCIYPNNLNRKIKENDLLKGRLESTNEFYSIAKILGCKMCESINKKYSLNYFSIMPTNTYGQNDNYDDLNSHVMPALLKKFYLAEKNKLPQVEVWGSGKPLREFIYVDDLASGIVKSMINNKKKFPYMNIGYGDDISIKKLAFMIKKITKFDGKIVFNTSKPDGTKRKLLDSSRIRSLGWTPKIDLEKGIRLTLKTINRHI